MFDFWLIFWFVGYKSEKSVNSVMDLDDFGFFDEDESIDFEMFNL